MINAESINMKRIEPEEVVIGRRATFSKTITDADLFAFGGITGDFNPIHVNEEVGKARMGGRIAQGMLTASLLSTIMGMGFPTGGVFLEQLVKFKAPVFVGDTVTASGEIIEITPTKSGKRIITMKMLITNQKDEVVIEGIGKSMSPGA